MPTTVKAPAKSNLQTATAPPHSPAPLDRFPFAQYASVLGVHLILVGFTALYLPQSTRLFTPLAAVKTDRPQSQFMEAFTADPSLTLSWACAGFIPLQMWWASWVRRWFFERTAKGSEVEIKLERVRFESLYFTRLKDATAFTLYAALAIHVVLVMFGAPITTHILRTGLLAFVIAILTVLTPAFVLGSLSLSPATPSMINRLTWTRLFAELSPRNAVECLMVYPAAGTLIGAWIGAIPIALDWGCPWQAWPLTPFLGSVGGYIIGALLAFAFNTAGWLAAEHIRLQPSKSKTS